MIVDDEPYNIMSLMIVIQSCGFVGVETLVDTALNGLEAYRLIKKAAEEQKESYGLIFMDCSMPVMDGFEATRKIRKYLRDSCLLQPSIVAVTGHTEEEYLQKAWECQMDEVMPKPVKLDVMVSILTERLDIGTMVITQKIKG